jgi:hypothetical protein
MTTDPRARALALVREARALVEQLGEAEREALHDLDNAIITLTPDEGLGAKQGRAIALEKARELERWLNALADRIEGQPEYRAVATACDTMDIVVGDLEPDVPGDAPPRPRLRIVGG